jgi:hypothetical protein
MDFGLASLSNPSASNGSNVAAHAISCYGIVFEESGIVEAASPSTYS